MRKSTKITAAVGGAALVVVTAGTAYAYWTTSGSGTGTGAAAAPQAPSALTFTGQTVLSAMYPGDVAQPFSVTVTNTGSQNAYVGSVKAYLTVAKKQNASSEDVYTGSCGASDFLLSSASGTLAAAPGDANSAIALTWTAAELAKTNGNALASGKIQFNDSNSTNQDGCKEAAVTIHYVAS